MHAGVGHGGLVSVCVCMQGSWGYEGWGVGAEANEGVKVAMKVCLEREEKALGAQVHARVDQGS